MVDMISSSYSRPSIRYWTTLAIMANDTEGNKAQFVHMDYCFVHATSPHHTMLSIGTRECHQPPTYIWTLIKIWILTEWQYDVSNSFLISWPMTPVNVDKFTVLDLEYRNWIYFWPTSYTRTWWILEVDYGLRKKWYQHYRYDWHHTRHIPNHSIWYIGIRHWELKLFGILLRLAGVWKYWCSIHVLIQVTQQRDERPRVDYELECRSFCMSQLIPILAT